MKQTNTTVSMKLSTKVINNATKGITAVINTEKKQLKQERKTLKATVSFIATSDSSEAASFREFLNLPKNANKQQRNNICAWVEQRAPYVARKIYVSSNDDEVNVEFSGLLPVNKNGKHYTDMLDVIAEVKKIYSKIIATRNAIANEMIKQRALLIQQGMYTDHIHNVLSYVNRAPQKIQKQITLADVIIRK